MNCLACKGACCESFSLPASVALPKGTDVVQIDLNRWLALHATNDGESLTFECRCTRLGKDGRCMIHETRPVVCRTYLAGGIGCLAAVATRRSAKQYQLIRGPNDPSHLTK
jgi:Fe-S-cluster containining protein